MHTVSTFTFKKVKRLCCFQLGCRMNSALNCEGHFLNLCCSVDPSPVGGSPFLATQVRGPVAWRGGWWEVQAATYSFLTLSLTLASYHTEALLNIPKQKWAFNITDTTNLLRNIEKWDLAACYEERLHSKYAPNGWRLSFLIPKMQFSNVVYFHYTLCFKWHLLTVST